LELGQEASRGAVNPTTTARDETAKLGKKR
jgi:hypothetical protein